MIKYTWGKECKLKSKTKKQTQTSFYRLSYFGGTTKSHKNICAAACDPPAPTLVLGSLRSGLASRSHWGLNTNREKAGCCHSVRAKLCLPKCLLSVEIKDCGVVSEVHSSAGSSGTHVPTSQALFQLTSNRYLFGGSPYTQ